jgi:hypothetical protein
VIANRSGAVEVDVNVTGEPFTRGGSLTVNEAVGAACADDAASAISTADAIRATV